MAARGGCPSLEDGWHVCSTDFGTIGFFVIYCEDICMPKHYMGHIPGWSFAIDLYAENEADARAELRSEAGVTRLPAGSAVWLHEPLPDSCRGTDFDCPNSAASGM